ncbi:MAG: hypothetical protein RBU21_16165, partial [FCB group bacterium]|nr:hypothetical protein [FCB group bacterium]
DTLWLGSLNTLSHRDTQEIMERRQNSDVLKHYIQILCLDDLLRAKDQTEDRCSVCNSEVVADEGRDQPFYWHCVEGCFTRSIGRPFPRDEVPT